MNVFVSKIHIQDGKRGNPGLCPIALALKALYPDEYITVGATYAFVGSKEFQLDDSAVEALSKYDKFGRMKPQQVTLLG